MPKHCRDCHVNSVETGRRRLDDGDSAQSSEDIRSRAREIVKAYNAEKTTNKAIQQVKRSKSTDVYAAGCLRQLFMKFEGHDGKEAKNSPDAARREN